MPILRPFLERRLKPILSFNKVVNSSVLIAHVRSGTRIEAFPIETSSDQWPPFVILNPQ
jgi:hypothetical protein